MALGDETAWLLGDEYNFCPYENTRYERWELEDDEVVIRLANIQETTNVYVKFDES